MSGFLNDKDIAAELCLSRSWVRKQRWLRSHGLDHVFTVDPVMIGRVPRYRQGDLQSWTERLGGLKEARGAVR